MFSMDKHVIRGNPDGPGLYYIAIDYGTMNPTAMGLWRVYRGEAVMLKEYYYDGRAKKKQKTDEEYYQDLENFADGKKIERVIIDPSAASFKECIHRHGKFAVWDADNSVLDGIRLTATLLQTGRIKFHESCENTFQEFQSYMWDGDAGEDKVIKESDHSMDQMRYFVTPYVERDCMSVFVGWLGRLKNFIFPQAVTQREFGVKPATGQTMERNINLWFAMYVNRPPWAVPPVVPMGLPAAICREIARPTLAELTVSIAGSARRTITTSSFKQRKKGSYSSLSLGLQQVVLR